jgi:FkbM family methyltransferase
LRRKPRIQLEKLSINIIKVAFLILTFLTSIKYIFYMEGRLRMGMIKKIYWRLDLIKKALLSRRMTDWVSITKEIFSSHKLEPHHPQHVFLRKSEGLGLYEVGEKKIWFPLSFDPSILSYFYTEIFEWRVYEKNACSIRPGDWVVDAGACEGFFSLYVLERGAQVLAFEPVPELARALKKTLEEYIDAGRARVFTLGLGKEREEKTIFLHPTNSGGNTLNQEFTELWGKEKAKDQKTKVLIVSLDEIVSSLKLSIGFLKADVEGFERELLLGARDTISRCKPCLSICTYHLPDDWKKIPEIIQSFGVNYKMRFIGLFDHIYGWKNL